MTTRLFRLLGVVLVLAALAYPLRAMTQQDRVRLSRVDAQVAAERAPVRTMAAADRRAAARFRRVSAQQLPARPAHVHERPGRPERLGLDRATHRDQAAPREVAGRQRAAQGDNLQDDCAERDARQRLRHARGGDRVRSTGRQDDDRDRDAHDSAGHRAVPGDDRRRGVVAHPPRLHRVQLLGHGRRTRHDRDSCIPSTTSPRWGRSPSRCRPLSITC